MQAAQANTPCVRAGGEGGEGSNWFLLISCPMKYKLGLEMVLKIDELYVKIIRECN